ncbi:MarR family transcriptional regulator, partial [Arthrobacter deserti]|nr:MarR family transcriptional regulator [Arthrobacter deserti]
RENVFDPLTPEEQDALLAATTKIQHALRAAGWWERGGRAD